MNEPDYKFWDGQEGLTQVQAAFLWCGQEPSFEMKDRTAQIVTMMDVISRFLNGRYQYNTPGIFHYQEFLIKHFILL